MEYTGISQVHSSCKNYIKDETTKSNFVSYSYLDGDHVFDYDVVDVDVVKKLVLSVR